MLAIVVEFQVKPAGLDAFKTAVAAQARNSVENESGCTRFDVCYSRENPTECHLYELYDDQAAIDAHLATPYFEQFGKDVQDLLVSKKVAVCDVAERNPAD